MCIKPNELWQNKVIFQHAFKFDLSDKILISHLRYKDCKWSAAWSLQVFIQPWMWEEDRVSLARKKLLLRDREIPILLKPLGLAEDEDPPLHLPYQPAANPAMPQESSVALNGLGSGLYACLMAVLLEDIVSKQLFAWACREGQAFFKLFRVAP